MIILTCVKVLVCIVETCICRITLSINGLGPVRNPIRSLCKNKNILKILYLHIKCHVQNCERQYESYQKNKPIL